MADVAASCFRPPPRKIAKPTRPPEQAHQACVLEPHTRARRQQQALPGADRIDEVQLNQTSGGMPPLDSRVDHQPQSRAIRSRHRANCSGRMRGTIKIHWHRARLTVTGQLGSLRIVRAYGNL